MASNVVEDQAAVFAFLADPRTHGGREVARIDTHGAAIFLAGPDVYKVKRAVVFPFMDFSTRERRAAACAREVELNADTAPGLYLGVVPIVRAGGGLQLGGDGEVVEHAVHMRRFDEGATLDRAPAERFDAPLVSALAQAVRSLHARAEPRPETDIVAFLAKVARENMDDIHAYPDLFPPARAAAVEAATRAALAAHAGLLAARAKAGKVRRCHGDLHLRNIVLIEDRPVIFDALEFDEALATCDVLYDLAFLLMDLWERGRRAAANGVLNRYLWSGGEEDYAGLAVLPLFLSLRAVVRAKVTALGLAHLPAAARANAQAQAQRYFDLADAFLHPPAARLVAVGGLSGSGKSTLAAAIAPRLGAAPGAVWLRSDIERKAMSGVAETERLPDAAYGQASSGAVYARMRRRAGLALTAGHGAIADAVHARPEERDAIAQVAQAAGVPFQGLWLDAPLPVLVERVEARRDDASDATADVVRHQAAYALGTIGWTRIDVSSGAAAARAAALAALDLPPEPD